MDTFLDTVNVKNQATKVKEYLTFNTILKILLNIFSDKVYFI